LTRSASVARSTLLATLSTLSTFLATTSFHFSPLSYMVSKLLAIASTLFCSFSTWPVTVIILASIAKARMFSATYSIVTSIALCTSCFVTTAALGTMRWLTMAAAAATLLMLAGLRL
jgi:hypothetical protein